MIVGIGIDIISENDFEQRVKKSPKLPTLISRLTSPAKEVSDVFNQDIAYGIASTQRAISDFVALEALFKAMPVEWRSELEGLRILRDSLGKPHIEFPSGSKKLPKGLSAHVSISNQSGITIGLVIIELL